MLRYLFIFTMLLFSLFSKGQDYVLDSMSGYTQFFHWEGSVLFTTNVSYTYDDEQRLILLANGEVYIKYFYSDTLDVEEMYIHNDDRLVRRTYSHHDDEGFEIKMVIENFTEEGEPFVKVEEYYERDENSLLIGIERYELILSALRLDKSTEILRDSDGNEFRKVIRHFIYGSDYYDYNYYKDSIESVYLDGRLAEKHYFSFYTTGEMDRCNKKSYSYHDNYLVEEINVPDNEDCTSFKRDEFIQKYYADHFLYEYDSILVYRENDEGLDFYSHEEYDFDQKNENEIVVTRAGGLVSMDTKFEFQYFYSKPIVSYISFEKQNLDIKLYPTQVQENGLITIDSDSHLKLKIEVFDHNGIFINHRIIDTHKNRRVEVPNKKGMYFIKISENQSSKFVVKKLIVF